MLQNQAHVTLIRRLYNARRFAQIKIVLNGILTNDDLRCPVSEIVSLIEDQPDGVKFVGTLRDLMFRVMRITRCSRRQLGFLCMWARMGWRLKKGHALRSCLR